MMRVCRPTVVCRRFAGRNGLAGARWRCARLLTPSAGACWGLAAGHEGSIDPVRNVVRRWGCRDPHSVAGMSVQGGRPGSRQWIDGLARVRRPPGRYRCQCARPGSGVGGLAMLREVLLGCSRTCPGGGRWPVAKDPACPRLSDAVDVARRRRSMLPYWLSGRNGVRVARPRRWSRGRSAAYGNRSGSGFMPCRRHWVDWPKALWRLALRLFAAWGLLAAPRRSSRLVVRPDRRT